MKLNCKSGGTELAGARWCVDLFALRGSCFVSRVGGEGEREAGCGAESHLAGLSSTYELGIGIFRYRIISCKHFHSLSSAIPNNKMCNY